MTLMMAWQAGKDMSYLIICTQEEGNEEVKEFRKAEFKYKVVFLLVTAFIAYIEVSSIINRWSKGFIGSLNFIITDSIIVVGLIVSYIRMISPIKNEHKERYQQMKC
jgi:hypothetical protein